MPVLCKISSGTARLCKISGAAATPSSATAQQSTAPNSRVVAIVSFSRSSFFAPKASLISTSETPFSLLFAYLILGEVLTISQGIGCALIVASILAATMPSKRRILEMAKRDANGKDGAGGADAGA